MLDIMYEIPSLDDLREVVITEEVVRYGAEPLYTPVRYEVPG